MIKAERKLVEVAIYFSEIIGLQLGKNAIY